jgi:hypothetical protein
MPWASESATKGFAADRVRGFPVRLTSTLAPSSAVTTAPERLLLNSDLATKQVHFLGDQLDRTSWTAAGWFDRPAAGHLGRHAHRFSAGAGRWA